MRALNFKKIPHSLVSEVMDGGREPGKDGANEGDGRDLGTGPRLRIHHRGYSKLRTRTVPRVVLCS